MLKYPTLRSAWIKGFYLTIAKDVFDCDATVEIAEYSTRSLTHVESTFRVSSTVTSDKIVEVAIRLKYEPSIPSPLEGDAVPFVEIKEGGDSFLTAGRLQKRTVDNQAEYCVMIHHALFKEGTVEIGGGVLTPVIRIKPVFHPVQHHFKINETQIDKYANPVGGSTCRRSGSENCQNPSPQTLYPACYPAAWANLCSSYRMTPLHPRRRWELGTPNESNPPPNESGDFFSTWAMGTHDIGESPLVSRIEDWQADETSPTPIRHLIHQQPFRLEEGDPDENKITRRATLIKNYLLRVVGGVDISNYVPGLRPPRPALVRHSGHAWNVVGTEKDGFWSHAQNPEAFKFSDWCLWRHARWLKNEIEILEAGNDPHQYYYIHYPRECALKPIERRLGCLNFQGSGDNYNHIQFVDVNYPIPDVNADAVTVINWTPYTKADDTGYLWIEGNVPLTQYGLPETRHEYLWDRVFGRKIPQPALDFGHCSYCASLDGCKWCRLRLMLPFWVHNTTLDQLVTYRVALEFWSKDQRWVSLEANHIQAASDGNYHGFPGLTTAYPSLPGPLPGELFSIQAEPETSEEPGRKHPMNSQPIAWYIDFHKDQLVPEEIHGIRLVLRCIEAAEEPICLVQDIKQLWFRVTTPPMI